MTLDPRVHALAVQVHAATLRSGRQNLARALARDVHVLHHATGPAAVAVAGRTGAGKSALARALGGVIDTPALDVAGAAAPPADALVLVLDPEAPVGAAERRFLAEAAAGVGEVVFVVAKADVAIDVETVVAADRTLLAAIDPRWAGAPIHAVSALELRIAEDDGDAALAEASGVPALKRHVRTRLADYPGVLRSAAAVQRCRATLRRLAEDGSAAAATAAAGEADAAVARQQAYVALTSDWAAEFGREYYRRTRQVIERDLRMRLLERRELRELKIKSGNLALEEVTAEVKADLQGVAERVEGALAEQVAALVGDYAFRLDLGAVHLPTRSDLAGTQITGARIDLATVTWEQREAMHGIAGVLNMARSAATGRSLAGVLPGGLAMGTGLGIVLTGLSWCTSEWLRTKMQDQQGAIAFVQAAFARAQIELEAALRDQAVMLQPVAQAALQPRIDERRRDLALAAAELQQEAKRRLAAREAATRDLAGIEPLRRALDRLGDRFTSVLRTGQVPPAVKSSVKD